MKVYLILGSILFLLSNKFYGTGIAFKENKGQWPKKVLFGNEFRNLKFYINNNGFNYCVYDQNLQQKSDSKTHIVKGHNYEVNFEGADFSNTLTYKSQEAYYNYFLGQDKSKWTSNIRAFEELIIEEIYPGINLKLYSKGANIEYDLILRPHADANKINLQYNFTQGISISNGEIHIKTSIGKIIEKKPIAYQLIKGKTIPIECRYLIKEGNKISFEFPKGYDKNYELIIDPIVVVCSYSDSMNYSDGSACTYDENGNIYTAGVSDFGYPTTSGAFQVTFAGPPSDIIISKYNTSGSTKIFSSYFGGTSDDFPFDINVKNNEITFFGQTTSDNFPCSSNSYDNSYNGGYDLFVSKISLDGTQLIASTYVGGNNDEGLGILQSGGFDRSRYGELDCDALGNTYLISNTVSNDFPVSSGAISSVLKGNYDACAFKLNSDLSNLSWSTYIGGSLNENGKGIRHDEFGGAYIFGCTNSNDFQTTAGVISSSKNGMNTSDTYIAHINPSGTTLISSTYLGTTASDHASLMDIDSNGDIYLCGNISNTNALLPTVGTYNNTTGRNTIYKVNPSLTNILLQTKFGSMPAFIDPYLYISAFKVDSCGNIYIAGHGGNSLPTTSNKFQSYGGGMSDMYMAVFKPNCSALLFGSFYGGAKDLWGAGEHTSGGVNHFDNKGVLYHAITSCGLLPTTSNAYSPSFLFSGNDSIKFNDAFIKVDFETFIKGTSSVDSTITGCEPYTVNFVSNNTGTISWNFGDGSAVSNISHQTHTFNSIGTYQVTMIVTDTASCNNIDSVISTVTVIKPLSFDLGPDMYLCNDKITKLECSANAVSYLWNTGENSQSIIVTNDGNYNVIASNGTCETTDDIEIVVAEDLFVKKFPNVITPNEDGINDFIDFKEYDFSTVEFILYNRWGNEVFKTDSPITKWSPKNIENGTYYFVIKYHSNCMNEDKMDKGYISVFK